MEFFGFENGVDIYPQIYADLSPKERIYVFLTLFNSSVGADLQIPLDCTQFSSNLKELFEFAAASFIAKNVFASEFTHQFGVSFYLNSNDIIAKFVGSKDFRAQDDVRFRQIRKFISLFESGSLYFSAQDLFCDYVFARISRIHKDKEVICDRDFIAVNSGTKTLTLVVPVFKFVDEDYENTLCSELEFARKKRDELSANSFLACPRHGSFTRFIELDKRCSETKFRLVPYSICDKIFLKEKYE